MSAGVYDHLYGVTVIDGMQIQTWSDAADALSVAPIADNKQFVEGIGGSVFVFTNKDAQTVVFKLLQNSDESKKMNQIYKMQSNAKTFRKVQGTFLDTINGDSLTMIDGAFVTGSPFVRGNAHNEEVWTMVFAKVERN